MLIFLQLFTKINLPINLGVPPFGYNFMSRSHQMHIWLPVPYVCIGYCDTTILLVVGDTVIL
jgi:hypothetical protein